MCTRHVDVRQHRDLDDRDARSLESAAVVGGDRVVRVAGIVTALEDGPTRRDERDHVVDMAVGLRVLGNAIREPDEAVDTEGCPQH